MLPVVADDDLTDAERGLTLGALWAYRRELTMAFDRQGMSEDAEGAVHEIETLDRLDSAARTLRGDPAENLYGAPEY